MKKTFGVTAIGVIFALNSFSCALAQEVPAIKQWPVRQMGYISKMCPLLRFYPMIQSS